MAVGCSVERLRRTTAAVVCIGLDVCLRLFMFVYVCLNFLGRLTSGKPDLRVCLCLFMFIYEAAAGKRKTLAALLLCLGDLGKCGSRTETPCPSDPTPAPSTAH